MAAALSGCPTLTSLHRRQEYGVVFLCRGCQAPIGDTHGWSGNHVEDEVVLLRAVSPFVTSGKRTISKEPGDFGSVYEPLSCSNCHNVLGKFYSSTPAHLSYGVNLYNINNAIISGYTLGENLQQVVPSSEAPITLELCQYYEEEIDKQKILLGMSLDRLSKLENDVLSPPGPLKR